MHDRTVLGTADVSDEQLADFVGRLLHLHPQDELVLLESWAEVAPYDLDALTTAGRFWVRGRAATATDDRPFAFFVKIVQSWSRSPVFALVPEDQRAQALAALPWQVEPAVYRSDLAGALPPGLSMPRVFAVVDLDEASAALWLEAVDCDPSSWDEDRIVRAAHALGRLAGRADVRRVAGTASRVGQHTVRGYAEGRVAHQVLPALRSDVWAHPLVAASFDAVLRERLLAAAGGLSAAVDELEEAPLAAAHGDACSRNLLVAPDGPGFVLIDFGFFGLAPVGFDLGQLLVGEVQLGDRSADCLPALEARCLPAYADGLRAEGSDVDLEVLRRAHALQLLVFSGLSALPFEHLGAPPTPELHNLARQRAHSAAFILDLVDATAWLPAVEVLATSWLQPTGAVFEDALICRDAPHIL